MKSLKKYFITGLVFIVPFTLTVYILVRLFLLIDGIIGKFLTAFLQNTLGFYIPGVGFLAFVLIIIFLGMLAARLLSHRVYRDVERWFSGLPLIKNLYPAIKQIVSFMSAEKEFGFKKVVLVEYPSQGLWSLGFLTNDGFDAVNKSVSNDMVSVFIPTSPGPLTGNMIFVARKDLRFVDLSVEEAFNIIISAGVFRSQS